MLTQKIRLEKDEIDIELGLTSPREDKNTHIDYVSLDAAIPQENKLIDMNHEVSSTIPENKISGTTSRIRQQLQTCKKSLKIEIDQISWKKQKRALGIYGAVSIFGSLCAGAGAAAK